MKCKECGKECEWKQSEKGKWYLVEIKLGGINGNGQRNPAKLVPHFLHCNTPTGEGGRK